MSGRHLGLVVHPRGHKGCVAQAVLFHGGMAGIWPLNQRTVRYDGGCLNVISNRQYHVLLPSNDEDRIGDILEGIVYLQQKPDTLL